MFNKKNASEAKEKFPSNVNAQTFNAFCGEYVKKATGTERMKVGASKVSDIIYSIWPKDLEKKIEGKSAINKVKGFVEKCKAFMLTHKSDMSRIVDVCTLTNGGKDVDQKYINIVVKTLEMVQFGYKGV